MRATQKPKVVDTKSKSEWIPEISPSRKIVERTTPQGYKNGAPATSEGYYGIPILKRPPWRWQIAGYFFLEAISAGAFLIGCFAGWRKRKNRGLQSAAHAIAFATLLPCPPLLIADLGRPARFHHMLRVFKPSSPMNFGAWTLLAFGLPATAAAARYLPANNRAFRLAQKIANSLPLRAGVAGGIPLAMILMTYPGILLSTTSTPVWSETSLLGSIFACSAFNSSASAISLAFLAHNRKQPKALEKIRHISGIAEVATLSAYAFQSRKFTKPLTTGKFKAWFWLGALVAGHAIPSLLSRGNRKEKRIPSLISSMLSLLGTFSLKWALVHAGRESAQDIHATHEAMRNA